MAKKDKLARSIDAPSAFGFQGGVVDSTIISAPPGIGGVPAPFGLTGTSSLVYSAVTPTVGASLTWVPGAGTSPDTYRIQHSTDISFPPHLTVTNTVATNSAFIDNLSPNTTYYFRVAAVFRSIMSQWSEIFGLLTTTDTTPPTAIAQSSMAWSWPVGDLIISWVNPTSSNFKDTRVEIWSDPAKTVKYVDTYVNTTSYVFSAAHNASVAPGGNADPSLYVELTSRSWNNVLSTATTFGPLSNPTSQPFKAAPATPTGIAHNFDGPECIFAWTAVSGAAHYIITIDGINYQTSDARFVYTFDQNRVQHAGVPDPVLTYFVRAIDGLGQGSAPSATATATNAPPIAITNIFSNWDADAGYASADLHTRWDYALPTDFDRYQIFISRADNTTVFSFPHYDSVFSYSYAQNKSQFTTAIPIIKISITVYDVFNQASSAYAETFTNVAPPQPTVGILAGFTSIFAQITNAQPVLDFDHYHYRLRYGGTNAVADGTIVYEWDDVIDTPVFDVSNVGYYKIGVQVYDKFQQTRTEIVSNLVFVDALTLAQLRAEGQYNNSIGTDFLSDPTGKANNLILKDNNVSAGISYTAGAWRWTTFSRPIDKIYNRIAFKVSSGNPLVVFQTQTMGANDTFTLRFWAGMAADGYTLTEYASLALAQAAAVNALTYPFGWVELPVEVEARAVSMWHNGAFRLDEYYPRTMVRSDDIEAESIRAINIAANAIVADKIAAGAITAVKLDVGIGGGNLARDGGFIYGQTHWTSYNGGTGVLPTFAASTISYSGVGTNQLIAGGAGLTVGQRFGLRQSVTNDIRGDGVSKYTMSAYLWATFPTVQLYIDWRGFGGTFLGGQTQTFYAAIDYHNAGGQPFSRISFTGTAPLNAQSADIYVWGNAALATDQIILSGIQFERGDVVTGWAPGYRGNVHIDGEGILVGIFNGARTVLQQQGLIGYDASNNEQVRIDSTTGFLRAGTAGGARVEIKAAGLEAFNSGNQKVVTLSGGEFRIGTPGAGYTRYHSGGVNFYDVSDNLLSNLDGDRLIFSVGGIRGVTWDYSDASFMYMYGIEAVGSRTMFMNLTSPSPESKINVIGIYSDTRTGFSSQINLSARNVATGVGSDLVLNSSGGITLHDWVGINTAGQSNHALTINAVSGGHALVVRNFGGGSNYIVISDTGTLTNWQAWAISSDRRLKENIVELDKGLEFVLSLKPKKYDVIDGAKDQWGFIAQEVLPVAPELLTTNDDGYYGMTLTNIIAAHTLAIQELYGLLKDKE